MDRLSGKTINISDIGDVLYDEDLENFMEDSPTESSEAMPQTNEMSISNLTHL